MNAQTNHRRTGSQASPRRSKHMSAAGALALAAIAFPGSSTFAQLHFQDVTDGAGTIRAGESWGSSWNDYNGDGWQDVFISSHRGVPRFYRNNADGTFTDVANDILPNNSWFFDPLSDTHAAGFGDVDNDGDDDFVWARWAPSYSSEDSEMLVNDGGVYWALGLQERVTARAAVMFDGNNDGFLDFATPSGSHWGVYRQIPSQGLVFDEDVENGSGCDVGGFIDHATLLDLNGDSSLELICASHSTFPIRAYDTSSQPFTDVTASVPSTVNVIETVPADFNGDLRNDILLLRGKLRASGATLISPNRIEAWLDGLDSSTSKGFRFTSAGEVSVTVDYNGLGAYGDPAQVVLNTAGPTSGTAGWVDVAYDSAAGEWIVSMTRNGSSNRRAYITVDTAQPAGSPQTFGITTREQGLPPRLITTTAAGLEFDFASGLSESMSCVSAVAGDFDNDMDLDIYMVCSAGVENLPNRLYRNNGDGTFTLVTGAGDWQGPVGAGLDSGVGVGESVSMADYDNDGFLDLFLMNGLMMRPWGVGGRDVLLRNTAGDSGNNNHWLKIDLEGTVSNRDGIGARVYVTAGGKTQYLEQAGGYHRFVQNDRRLHFGLAGNQTARVEIYWPSGQVDTFDNVAADRIYIANEADALQETTLGPPIEPPPSGIACGEPSYSSPTDTGVFLWRDCSVSGAEELWNVRITGGGSDSNVTYAGLITASATLQTEGFSLEGNDVLDSTPGDGTVDYDLKAIRGGQDGFALRFADGASVCFDPTTLPAGAVVKVGASGQTLSGAFDLQTLGACDNPPPPPPGDPACGEPSYASPSDTGVFLWRDCSVTGAEELWNVRITGGGSDSTITYAGLITSSATLQTEGFSLEGNDILDSTPGDGSVDFDLKAVGGGQDGFALRFAEGASVCFDPATLPTGAVVKVGAGGQTVAGAFDLQTLEACDGTPPPPSDPACGEPSYSSPSDTGVFLWRDCAATGAEALWNVRITGGGSASTITYAGLISSSATLQTEDFSLEGNDILDSTPGDGSVDFELKAVGGGQDGFALRFAGGASVCFDPSTLPAGAVVKVGAGAETPAGAFDLQTLGACN
ncbi:MAG: CRTAC1 family protein [Thiohalocapsa sp.]|nr:CRTAC1 family protein [Thiohalocapsa sp.]